MITISRELVRDGVGTDVLTACLKRHDALLPDMQRLRAYYEGRNPAILERADGERGQTRLPHPFGRYIALTAAGYLTGRPIAYEAPGQEAALEALTRSFHQNAMDSVDAELAVQAAVYGKGVERVYTDRLGRTHSVTVSPEEAFVVYDDTVAHEPLFGLCLSPLSSADGTPEGFQLEVLTGCQLEQGWHTHTVTGPDGEPVEERVPDEDPARRLRRERCLSLPDSEASAQYLTHSLHEADTEVLRAAIKEDIHKFSFVPDLSDRQFAQNQSGVAMKYKLMGLERMASVKERWFREGLRTRLRIYARILALSGGPELDTEKVEARFFRAVQGTESEM